MTSVSALRGFKNCPIMQTKGIDRLHEMRTRGRVVFNMENFAGPITERYNLNDAK